LEEERLLLGSHYHILLGDIIVLGGVLVAGPSDMARDFSLVETRVVARGQD